MIAGLFDDYPQASSTKMIAGLFDAYCILEIGTYKPSSVTKFHLHFKGMRRKMVLYFCRNSSLSLYFELPILIYLETHKTETKTFINFKES